jgi:hypothetical protein
MEGIDSTGEFPRMSGNSEFRFLLFGINPYSMCLVTSP